MDAFGKDVVIVETVGVGQSEIEIAELADTTLVALQPGSGDSVQLLKAGILEVADVFVVNKADHPMALQLQRDIRSMMEMLDFSGWVPELIATQAREGVGVADLWAAIARHDAYLRESGALTLKRREAFAHRVRALVLGDLERRVETRIAALLASADEIPRDPYSVADVLLRRVESALPRDAGDDVPVAHALRSSVKGM
jgi:LAO/AO transport system kinase